jgi:hypothetical protein
MGMVWKEADFVTGGKQLMTKSTGDEITSIF